MSRSDRLYLFLAALFIAALVVTNLIANKFLTVDLGFRVFVLSAGALAYPLTFLVTDLLSEIWGKQRANAVVWAGFGASALVMGILWLGGQFPAIADSPVGDSTYDAVFHNAWRVILASMLAYLTAQFIDIRLFHFWKRLTHGRHLWLRNNASTLVSQLVDSILVVVVLFWGVREPAGMIELIIDLWLFKTLIALADTPLFYLGTWATRRFIKENELPL
ncbi:MAG: queuosine precursor transporter [Planctomycetes bacterium]|jgi:hypothetical protein|nr:queuosine precursor transporter [Planctomycetota bacterium]MBT4029503.1 queuosine precursor transporter [Planctomycetota bacterium]MBT4560627.1 queuosine precursor transporter [Planctomycetota bacterium]MBT5101201.1 queuosine precursor transporter [Planctomycetota bacterium]MBT7012756.1 queuosine precursor transporter [Planctomycetota bacterium]